MKNTPIMEFKSCVVLPYYVSLQILRKQSFYLKNSHFPLSKTFANLHLLKRLGGQQQVEEIWKTSTILILQMGLCSVNMQINHLKNWIISQKVSLRFVFCFLLVCFLDYFSFTSPVYWKKKPKWKIKWLFQPTVLLFKTLFCRKSI